jgi:hypothetical protein
MSFTNRNVHKIRLDRVLLGIVFCLAGAKECQCKIKEYSDAIKEYFGQFKNHPVIVAAQIARFTRNIGHNAVSDYGIHISIENGHVVVSDENSDKTLERMDFRWTPKVVRHFAKLLDDFYVESRFHEFFESHREMYQKAEEKIKVISDKIDYSWFEKFFNANSEHFHIIIRTTAASAGCGVTCRFKDGHDEPFCVVTNNGPDAHYHEDDVISLIIHEFNHSFCNPLIEKYLDELKPAAQRVFPFVADSLAPRGYSEPQFMWNEYLVCACEIRYLLTHDMKDEGNRRIQFYRGVGFLWIEELVELLGRYEKERDKYPTLDDFMPEIVKMQNAFVTDEYIAELRNWAKDARRLQQRAYRAGRLMLIR